MTLYRVIHLTQHSLIYQKLLTHLKVFFFLHYFKSLKTEFSEKNILCYIFYHSYFFLMTTCPAKCWTSTPLKTIIVQSFIFIDQNTANYILN